MLAALKFFPGMEVALKRLYSILLVEDTVRESMRGVTRGSAWAMANKILEVHPASGLRVTKIDHAISLPTTKKTPML